MGFEGHTLCSRVGPGLGVEGQAKGLQGGGCGCSSGEEAPGVEKKRNGELEKADVSERNLGKANRTHPGVSVEEAGRDTLDRRGGLCSILSGF